MLWGKGQYLTPKAFFAGIEGLAVLGLKGTKYLGKTDDVVPSSNYVINFSGGNPTLLDDPYSPGAVSQRIIDSRGQYGYLTEGDYAGSFMRPNVKDEKLQFLVKDIYKGETSSTGTIGSGSTADAARWENNFGELLKNKDHLKNKGPQYINAITSWLNKHPNASPEDKHAASEMLKDLQNAMKGQKNGD